MHFRKLMNSDFLASDDFTDGQAKPVERTLTIKAVYPEKPPAAGKDSPTKACFEFDETPKRAFLSNTQLKKIMNCLRCAETDMWVGAKLVITSAPTKFKGQPTTGMVVVSATK